MANKKKKIIIAYTIVFYILWMVWEMYIKAQIDYRIPNIALNQFVKSGVIKNVVWTVPAIILIRYFRQEMYITLDEMFRTKVNWLAYMPIFIVFTIYIFVAAFMEGNIGIQEDFGIDCIIIVLFVGLTEEMVFRGWLLNATICEKGKWLPILINALMFVAIHFPIWLSEGRLIEIITTFSFMSVLILSMIFGWVFVKSKNILVPIALHMYWDLLMFMFV